MGFKKVVKKSLSDSVFEQLRDEIVSGRMEPGEALPAERGLSETLGVNRGAVREALKRLEQARLISIQQGGSTRVLDYTRTAGTDLLTALLIDPEGRVNTRVARSVMEMRSEMAADIARLAARRRRDDHLALLDGLLGQMHAQRADLVALQDLGMEFWTEMVQAADNVAYQLAVNSLRESYGLFKRLLLNVLSEELADLEGYRAVVDAVRAQDEPEAEYATRELLGIGQGRIDEALTALEATQGEE